MMGERNCDDELFEPLVDEPGPALPLAAEHSEAIARAAVRKARAAAPSRWRSPLSLAAAAALALSLAGSAAAAIAYLLEAREASAPGPAEPVARAPRTPEPRAMQQPPSEPAAVAPTEERSIAREPLSASPGELLERANRLRALARYVEAERLYARVARDPRDVESAYVAMVAAAELRLEHVRQPKEALALYERALRQRPEGVLAASVRFGIARAHRSLGHRDAEARALAELVAEHPGHVLRARAQARLAELRAEP